MRNENDNNFTIHPEFVNKIMNGEKKFEFRKVLPRHKPNKIIIYSTARVPKIFGEAEVEEILLDSPQSIWEQTKNYSGVNEEFYSDYYRNKKLAIAYKLKNVIEYPSPLHLPELGVTLTPQSFVYITKSENTYL